MPTLSSSSRSTLAMPDSASSSEVRSCISFWAFWGSFQRLGSSASLFSSASRAVDCSTSKMPPQQPDRLLDLFNEAFDFGAHGVSDLRCLPPTTNTVTDVAAYAAKRNRLEAWSQAVSSRNRALVKPAGSRQPEHAGLRRRALRRSAVGISHANDGIIIRRRGARLEGFQNGAAALAGTGAHAALGINADQLDAGRHLAR